MSVNGSSLKGSWNLSVSTISTFWELKNDFNMIYYVDVINILNKKLWKKQQQHYFRLGSIKKIEHTGVCFGFYKLELGFMLIDLWRA